MRAVPVRSPQFLIAHQFSVFVSFVPNRLECGTLTARAPRIISFLYKESGDASALLIQSSRYHMWELGKENTKPKRNYRNQDEVLISSVRIHHGAWTGNNIVVADKNNSFSISIQG